MTLTDATPKFPSRFLTPIAQAAKLDGLRAFYKYETKENVSFLTGRPAYETFPITNISFTVRDPDVNSVAPLEDRPSTELSIEGSDLKAALQYGQTNGIPALRELLVDFQSEIHRRPRGDWHVVMGNGAQDLIWKAFQATIEYGDAVICETPMYTGCLPGLWSLGAQCIEIEVDEFGLSASKLEHVLSTWPSDRKRPKVIYTNPVGGNPSGCSATVERKLEILRLCAQYDMLIIEDDPYYYLSTELIPSYFELEASVIPSGGHVLRFDAFSKILSGGMRLGFVTGPQPLLDAIEIITAAISLFASNISQMMALKVLQHWGVRGFLDNAYETARVYEKKRMWFEPIAHAHLDGLATWQSPRAGLFLWVDCSPSGVVDSNEFMKSYGIPAGVLAAPGTGFYPSKSPSPNLRISFSELSKEEAEIGFARLATALKAAKAAA